MAKAYSLDLRERVLDAAAEGLTVEEAAARFRVSTASIVRWRRLARERGDPRGKPYGGGRPSRIEAARGAILELLDANPALTTQALRAALGERGFAFGYATVYGFLRRNGLGRRTSRRPGAVDEARETILGLLRGNPGLSVEALRAALRERGLVFGYATLYYFLQRHGLRRKSKRPGRRIDEVRDAVLRAAEENPGLGAGALREVLARHGLVFACSTVRRFLRLHGFGPQKTLGRKSTHSDIPARPAD